MVAPTHQVSKWRWLAFGVFVVVFPIVFRPWWMAIVTGALFLLLTALFYPGERGPK